MAFSTSNVYDTVINSIFEGMMLTDDSWRPVVRFVDTDSHTHREADLTGIPDIATWTSSGDLASLSLDSNGALDLTYVKKGNQVRIDYFDEMDIPGIVPMASRKLGESIASTYQAVAWAEMAGFGTNTLGAGWDSKTIAATDHPTSGSTRDNKLTSALDATALNSALQKLREWVNYQDQYYGNSLANGPLFLVVPPALEATARQLVGSEFTSSELQINVARSHFSISVVVSPYLTDDNDWFIVSGMQSPFLFFERSAPMITVTRDDDDRSVRIGCSFGIAADTGPAPDGLIGSVVA